MTRLEKAVGCSLGCGPSLKTRSYLTNYQSATQNRGGTSSHFQPSRDHEQLEFDEHVPKGLDEYSRRWCHPSFPGRALISVEDTKNDAKICGATS